MLTPEQIVRNTEKFFKTANTYGVMNEELTTFLGERFMKAPASIKSEYNNSFEGGLIDHILTVCKYAVIINEALPETERVSKESLLRVCLLHDIGKAHIFIKNESDWHQKQGINYSFEKSDNGLRYSEKSLLYINKFGIKLTDEEFSAIINFDKVDDYLAENNNTQLGNILKSAIRFAIKAEKNRNN